MDSIITETPSLRSISNTVISDYASTPDDFTPDSATMNFDWYSVMKYGVIIIVLALLGFNLFTFLGNTTDIISRLFGNAVSESGKTVGNVVATTATLAAEGTKGIANMTAGAVTSGVNILEKGIEMKHEERVDTVVPEPDEAGNVTQRGNKSGYCYIGEDRGFRSCVKVGTADTCMSGDIFPTEDICINPNLRQ